MPSEKTITLWAPECHIPWSSLLHGDHKLAPEPALGQGLIPVFASEEEARKHYPDRPLFSMRVVEVSDAE